MLCICVVLWLCFVGVSCGFVRVSGDAVRVSNGFVRVSRILLAQGDLFRASRPRSANAEKVRILSNSKSVTILLILLIPGGE